jgi:protein SCO1/2
MSRTLKLALALAVVIAVLIGAVTWRTLQSRGGDPSALLDAGIVLLPQPRPVADIVLVDQDGATTSTAALKGKWSLLFFGYTFCPDICPTTLAQLHKVLGRLPEDVRQQLRVVFVSVDPNRDTPQRIKQYVGFFDPAFQGWTGDPGALAELANAVSIPFIAPDTRQPGYTVSHSGNLAILDPQGRQQGFIRAPFSDDKLAERLPMLLKSGA